MTQATSEGVASKCRIAPWADSETIAQNPFGFHLGSVLLKVVVEALTVLHAVNNGEQRILVRGIFIWCVAKDVHKKHD